MTPVDLRTITDINVMVAGGLLQFWQQLDAPAEARHPIPIGRIPYKYGIIRVQGLFIGTVATLTMAQHALACGRRNKNSMRFYESRQKSIPKTIPKTVSV